MTTVQKNQSIPARIGQYDVIRKIGEGGLAEIYLASQKSLDRYVAIKVLHPRVSQNQELVRRFERESLTLAKLSHPNIVHVIDRGTDNDRLFFVMQFVEGTDFAKVITSKEWTRHKKLKIIVQVLKGLDYAHKNGIVHRDIKPANILIDREENALIADFGISQFVEADAAGHTQTGMVLGSYAYMSPEQREDSSRVDLTTDVYAVGLMLYECLTGKRPMGRFKLPSQLVDGLSDAYDQIVSQALQQNPADRYQKAVEMKDDLLAAMHRDETGVKGGVSQPGRSKTFVGNCSFLDTLKNSAYSSTYLVEERTERKLYVIKTQNKPDIGLTEARILSNIRHPNILPLHGAGSDSAKLVIIMDYAQGGSLADRMVKPMEWRDAVRIMRQIAAGMDFAHQSNVLHGNLRPQNVLFDREDVVKIADFSLFCSTDRKSGNPYLAPEKRKSRTGDIYSAGVIFYRLLTNRLPTADSSGRFLWVDSHRTISDHLRHLIEKMLKNNPADRIQSFAEVQEVLSRFSSRDQMYAQATAWPHRIEFNHRTMLLIGTFGLLVIIVCLYLFGFIG